MKTYADFCKAITKKLFDIIDEKGSLLKWHKNWESKGSISLPIGANGKYRGGNLLNLFCQQWQDGLSSNRWLTFNQIKKLDGQVKKGAKGEAVFFWKMLETKETIDGVEKKVSKPIFKWYYVFNLEQTTLSDEIVGEAELHKKIGIPQIELLIETLKINISNFGNSAYYRSSEDVIVLPRSENFTTHESYCCTLLHEMVHWTGCENRLNRDCFKAYSSDKSARAEEELVAEIGSLLLAIHFGVRGELENHAAYVSSWKKRLNEKQVMRATNKAAEAFEFLIKHQEIN